MKTIFKSKYFWIAVVAGLIIGDLIGIALFKANKTAEDDSSASAVTVVATTTSPFLAKVSDQPAGQTVFVSEMETSATSTWVAVREGNGDLLGRILGARRVDSTSATNVTIELLRPTEAHVMYAVVMYEDDGDGKFDHLTDTLVEEGGSVVSFPFTVR